MLFAKVFSFLEDLEQLRKSLGHFLDGQDDEE